MNFSMNGFRKQLSRDVNDLRILIQRIINGEEVDHEDLAEAANDVITHSNVVNCVYQKDDESFTDMSGLEVPLIEINEND